MAEGTIHVKTELGEATIAVASAPDRRVTLRGTLLGISRGTTITTGTARDLAALLRSAADAADGRS